MIMEVMWCITRVGKSAVDRCGEEERERDFHVTSSSFWILAQCAESEVFTLRVMANITTQNFHTRQIFMHTYIKCTLMKCKNLSHIGKIQNKKQCKTKK